MRDNEIKDISRATYTFSHSRLDIFAGKYLYLFGVVGWLILFVMELFWGLKDFSDFGIRCPVVSITFILPMFLMFYSLFYLCSYKHAYRVIFDFNKGLITLYLYRRRKPIIYQIEEIDYVRLNWFFSFIFKKEKTVWYKDDFDFIKFLNEHNIPRRWGKIGKLLLKKAYNWDIGKTNCDR